MAAENVSVAEVWEAIERVVPPFLPILTEVIEFGAVEDGQLVVEAVQRLPQLLGRKKVRREEITAGLVTGSWRRLVYADPNGEPGLVEHKAYAFCVLEHLHRALKRRDVDDRQSARRRPNP